MPPLGSSPTNIPCIDCSSLLPGLPTKSYLSPPFHRGQVLCTESLNLLNNQGTCKICVQSHPSSTQSTPVASCFIQDENLSLYSCQQSLLPSLGPPTRTHLLLLCKPSAPASPTPFVVSWSPWETPAQGLCTCNVLMFLSPMSLPQ